MRTRQSEECLALVGHSEQFLGSQRQEGGDSYEVGAGDNQQGRGESVPPLLAKKQSEWSSRS